MLLWLILFRNFLIVWQAETKSSYLSVTLNFEEIAFFTSSDCNPIKANSVWKVHEMLSALRGPMILLNMVIILPVYKIINPLMKYSYEDELVEDLDTPIYIEAEGEDGYVRKRKR